MILASKGIDGRRLTFIQFNGACARLSRLRWFEPGERISKEERLAEHQRQRMQANVESDTLGG